MPLATVRDGTPIFIPVDRKTLQQWRRPKLQQNNSITLAQLEHMPARIQFSPEVQFKQERENESIFSNKAENPTPQSTHTPTHSEITQTYTQYTHLLAGAALPLGKPLATRKPS